MELFSLRFTLKISHYWSWKYARRKKNKEHRYNQNNFKDAQKSYFFFSRCGYNAKAVGWCSSYQCRKTVRVSSQNFQMNAYLVWRGCPLTCQRNRRIHPDHRWAPDQQRESAGWGWARWSRWCSQCWVLFDSEAVLARVRECSAGPLKTTVEISTFLENSVTRQERLYPAILTQYRKWSLGSRVL